MNHLNILCDLILLTWNHLEITQRCLESLFRHTNLPSRLIVVDNGSDQPGASEYLQTVQPRGSIQEVVLIRNDQDIGFSKGMNTGLRFCLSKQPAPYICLISNDVIVSDGWLSELVQVAASNPTIGLVNPNSTNFGFYPAQGEEINEYGIRMNRACQGRWQELGSCIGFCFLVKKEVIDKVGLFDETYGMAYYEDADLSKRAQAVGYLCALAQGCYVYHEQGESFGKHQQTSPLFLRNEEIFYSRWGMKKSSRISYILTTKNSGVLNSLSQKIRQSANQFNKIWILCCQGTNGTKFPNHWNVRKIFFKGPRFLFSLWSLVYLLLKKKKFNTVFVDSPQLLCFLRNYQNRYQTQLQLLSYPSTD